MRMSVIRRSWSSSPRHRAKRLVHLPLLRRTAPTSGSTPSVWKKAPSLARREFGPSSMIQTRSSKGEGQHGHDRSELHLFWLHVEHLPKQSPHPCGYYGDIKRECRCSPVQIERYRQRISGPLLDRIDLHVEVPLVDFRELSSDINTGEKSETIRKRVISAREIQRERFSKSSNTTNSAMGSRQVRQHCKLDAESNSYLEHAMEQMNFSARAHDRILKVARTLADLGGSPDIRANDILEAIQYRSLDRKLFS
ncbi:MAG: ATP-binding protein [Verrucomicrobiaceae bacterium]|nr:MAG: ATP-binding protein [Verrucomicrobiaceae bacterium]